jgi:menaquinone-9 beta-reductase
MEKYEIIIVGSGPAGISTALSLIRIAPELADRTLILEKARHPRPKLCGGGLTIDAENLLRRLDLDTSDIPHVDAGTAHLEFRGRGLKFRQARGRALRFIRRDEFDAWLVAEARRRGVKIREGVKVGNLQMKRDGVILETDAGIFEAGVVIGADGSTGIIRKYLPKNIFSTTGRALEIFMPPNQESPHLPRDAYFEFSPVIGGIAGYMWDFPSQIHGRPVRVWGIYDSNLNMETKRQGMKELLSEELTRHGYHLEDHRLEGHPIHLFTPFNKFSSRRLLLVGDAAGADPFFGEGISMALAYGMIAAHSLRRAFTRQDFSFRDYPLRLFFSSLGRILTIRWLIANVLFGLSWGWFQFLVWRILKPLVNLVSRFLVINWFH